MAIIVTAAVLYPPSNTSFNLQTYKLNNMVIKIVAPTETAAVVPKQYWG